MRKIKGAFWPDVRKAACADLQRHYGCESLVASFFRSDFLTVENVDAQLIILDATPDQWKDIADDWEEADRRNTSLDLH